MRTDGGHGGGDDDDDDDDDDVGVVDVDVDDSADSDTDQDDGSCHRFSGRDFGGLSKNMASSSRTFTKTARLLQRCLGSQGLFDQLHTLHPKEAKFNQSCYRSWKNTLQHT